MALENAVAFLAVLTTHENSPALDCREKNSRHPGERREIRRRSWCPRRTSGTWSPSIYTGKTQFFNDINEGSGELSTQNQLRSHLI